MRVFLDDIRLPDQCLPYMHHRIGKLNPIYNEEWVIVRNYDDFVDTVMKNIDSITHVSFDHDLGEDVAISLRESGMSKTKSRASKKEVKSGYDCAVWMKKYYSKKLKELPVLFVHSMNPIGTQNIVNLFKYE